MLRRTSFRHLAVAAVVVVVSTTAVAQSISIVNAGFEADAITDGAFSVLVPTGWQVYDPSSIVDQGANSVGVIRPNIPQSYFPGGAFEGAQAALVFLAGAASGPAGLQQTLATTLAAQTRYTLSVGIGNIASGTSLPGSTGGANVFYNLDGFPGYRIELLAGNTVLGFDSDSAGVIPEGEWRTATLSVDSTDFGASIGEALTVRLVNLDTPGTLLEPAIEVDFDAVSLVAAPVPEPGTAALWLAGLGLLGSLTRRKRQPWVATQG